jgi:hypothetical protein
MHVPFSLVRGSQESYGASVESDRREKVFPFLPEKKLMIAVMEDAIACYLDHVGAKSISGKNLFEDSEKWFFDENDDRLFSFVNICLTIGLDPDYLRRGLRAARKTALAGRRPAKVYAFEKPRSAAPAEGRVCAECAGRRHPHPAPMEVDHADFRPT